MSQLFHTHIGDCLLCVIQTGEPENMERTICQILRSYTTTLSPSPSKTHQKSMNTNITHSFNALFVMHSKL